MDYPGIHVGRHHDGGRLQEENPTPAATSATTAAGPDSLNLGESQYDSKGPVDDAQLADHKRQRRIHRWHWRSTT